MCKHLFYLFFLVCTLSLVAQEKDSLSHKSNAELQQLILKNIRSNTKTSLVYSTYLLKRGKHTDDKTLQASALTLLGEANRVLGKLDMSLDYQLAAEKMVAELDEPRLKINVYNGLGNIYSDLGMYDKVLPSYFKAIKIAENNDFGEISLNLKNNLIYFKTKIGAYDEALEIVNKIQAVIRETQAESYRNDMMKTMVLDKMHQPDSVIFYGKRALKRAEELNDIFSQAGILDFIGSAYAEKNQFDNAFKALNKADVMGVELGNASAFLPTRYRLAVVHYYLKNYDEVIAILENSIEITERDNLNYINNDANYKLISKAYKEKGDYEKAHYYFEKYIQKLDFNSDQNHIIDAGFNEKKIADFRNELQQLKSVKNTRERYFWLMGSLAVLVILGLVFRLFHSARKRKQNEILFNQLHEKLGTLKTKEITSVVDTMDAEVGNVTVPEISNEVIQQILDGLKKLESQDYFLRQDCNAYNVSKKIKTNTSYLSKVVNAHYQKNFNTYINDLRINYAIVRLEDDKQFRSFSIQSIAEELGYKSADSFSKYFKQNTGLNPSFYIKQLNQLE